MTGVPRLDMSDALVHFIREARYTGISPFDVLSNIVRCRTLKGSGGRIKGQYPCICFSEAPPNVLGKGLINLKAYTQYSRYGIALHKNWLFQRGGRPVIYQPDSEFYALPESHRWRHVIYEPLQNPPVDFTWEREWRIQTDELRFDLNDVTVVVPLEYFKNQLIEELNNEWAEIPPNIYILDSQ